MDIDGIVDAIREHEGEKKEEAERIREKVDTVSLDGFSENLIEPVEAEGRDELAVGAVDGGLVRKEYHGVDIIMTRAVAAVFRYTGKELSTEYLPSRSPEPSTEHFTGSLGRQEVRQAASLLRLRSEVAAALEAVEDVDLLLMDGSLLPRTGDRPDSGSENSELYDGLIEDYRELYTRAEESGTLVAGVVEDSRSSRMCTLLQEQGVGSEVVHEGRDTVLLTYLLEAGERTVVTPYGDVSQPVIEDLGLGESFHVFYIRTVEKDRPVRIEFYSGGQSVERADEIASLLLSLCGEGSSYAVPPVLVEADQRAKLSGREVELLTKRVKSRLTHLPGIEDLRRNRRPF